MRMRRSEISAVKGDREAASVRKHASYNNNITNECMNLNIKNLIAWAGIPEHATTIEQKIKIPYQSAKFKSELSV